MLGHIRSVVLLKVYTHCIAIEPFKCDAPRAIDVQTIPRGLEAFEWVKVKARQVQLGQFVRCVQCVQSSQSAGLQIRPNLRASACVVQVGQSFVPKGSNHGELSSSA
jgi:hypothetical protein